MSSAAKRKVIQTLHNMGFSDADIRAAILECGYNVEACSDWIVNRKQNASAPRLHIGMDVWIFSREDNDWCPGNVVSVTKQLVSIIFKGHDFRWLEKESDIFRIQDDKPAPLATSSSSHHWQHMGNSDDDVQDAGPYHEDQYTAPRQDEVDYYVTFTESVLGLELYSDEDGFNCIVGRCVSTIARQKVTPGSQIVQVNDRWLANYRFEEIRDAVKQAARQPPLAVTFRIKKALYSPKDVSADNNNNNNNNTTAKLFTANNANNANNANMEEEKRSQPPNVIEQDRDGMGTLTMAQCSELQIGDHIDHRDDVGRFLLATIVDKDEYKVKIHYEGWNSKWDTWCDYANETHRFAVPRSISRCANTRFGDLKIRDYVDINPIQRHLGWRVGQIRRMDKYSGQAQIVYKEDGQEFLYWAHLNNPREIAPFMTRAAETIAIQSKMAEYENEQNAQNANANNNIEINTENKLKAMGYGVNVPPSTVNTGKATQYTNRPHKHVQNGSSLGSANQAVQQSNNNNNKSKSKAVPLPLTLIKRPLPPKPPKNGKKHNGVSRSRTQPLPENKNRSNLHDLNYNYQYTQTQVNNQNQNGIIKNKEQLMSVGQTQTMDLSYLDGGIGGNSKPLPPKPKNRKNNNNQNQNSYNDPSLL